MSQQQQRPSLFHRALSVFGRVANHHSTSTDTAVFNIARNDTLNQSDDDNVSVQSDTESVVAQAAKAITHAHGEHKRPASNTHSDRRLNSPIDSTDIGYISSDSMTAQEKELYEPFINDKLLFVDYVTQYFKSLDNVDLYRTASHQAITSNNFNEIVAQLYNDANNFILDSNQYTTFEYKLIEQRDSASNYLQLVLPTLPAAATLEIPTLNGATFSDESFDVPLLPIAPLHVDMQPFTPTINSIVQTQLCVTDDEPIQIKAPSKVHTTVYNTHKYKHALLIQYEPMTKWNQHKIRPITDQLQQLQYSPTDIDVLINAANKQHDEILTALLTAQQELAALTTQHDTIRNNVLKQVKPKHCSVYQQRYQQCQQHLHQLYYDAISFSSICKQYNRGYNDITVPTAYQQQLSADTVLHLGTDTNSTTSINSTDLEKADDDLQTCDVCHCGDATKDNPICFCERCNIAVHKRCYGLDSIPDVDIDWYCNRCTYTLLQSNDSFTAAGKLAAKFATMQPHSLAQSNIQVNHDISTQCVLCPIAGGALKPTNDGTWAHVSCALWTPHCTVDNYKTMEPIKNIAATIEHSKQYNANCYVCNKSIGAVIKCSTNKCARVMHAQCAWFAGLYMSTTSNESELLLQCYCTQHTPKYALNTIGKQYSELSQKQLIHLREIQQSQLRLKGRTDLFVPKVRNLKKNKTQSQRAASTSKPPTEDKLDYGRCAVCFYTNAELQQIFTDLAMWKIDESVHEFTDQQYTHHNNDGDKQDIQQPTTDKPIRITRQPVLPYPHQRTPNQHAPQQLLQCNKCGVEVHPVCYGVSVLTAQAVYDKRKQAQDEAINGVTDTNTYWTCSRCAAPHTQHVTCSICLRQGGALKPVSDGTNKWCHVLCALWIVGVEFGDVDKLEPITGINQINKQQRKLRCSLCKKTGPCIMCRQCDQTFHPLCNYLNGSYMGVYHTVPGSFEALYIAACTKHSTLLLSRPTVHIDAEYIDIMYKRITTYLALPLADRVYQREQVKEQLTDVDTEIVQLQRLNAYNERYLLERGTENHTGKVRLKLSRKSSGYTSDATVTSDTAQHNSNNITEPTTLTRRTSQRSNNSATDTLNSTQTGPKSIKSPVAVDLHPSNVAVSSNGDNTSLSQSTKKRKLSQSELDTDMEPAPTGKFKFDEHVYVQSGTHLYKGKVIDVSTIHNLILAYQRDKPRFYAEHITDYFTHVISGIDTIHKKRHTTELCYLIKHHGWNDSENTWYVESLVHKDTVKTQQLHQQQQIESKSKKKKKH